MTGRHHYPGWAALFVGTTFLVCSSSTFAQDAIIKVWVEDPLISAEVIRPADGKKLDARRTDDGAAAFDVTLDGRLVLPLLIGLQPTQPATGFQPLTVQVRQSGPPVSLIRLSVVSSQGTAKDCADLYSTKLQDVAQRGELVPFYQRARAVSLARIQRLGDDWSSLSTYDVVAVYKYLEVVRELNRNFILQGSEFARVRDWFDRALRENPERVKEDVGLANARQMLQQVDAMSGTRLMILWKTAIAPASPIRCRSRLPRLNAFLSLVDESDEAGRQGLWTEANIERGTVLSAIAQCTAIRATCDTSWDESGRMTEVSRLADAVDVSAADARDPRTRELLRSNSASLRNMIRDLQAGKPALCPRPDDW